MENKKNTAFRSALSGYNREDVNRYILELDRRLEEQQDSLRKTSEEAAAQISDYRQKHDDALRQAAEAQKALTEAENVISALREELERLRCENEQMRISVCAETERASAAESALSEAQKSIHALQNELASRPSEEKSSEKSQKYDQISAQIGDILINANQSADTILSSAHAEAARIVTETEEEANYIRTRLSDTADEMLTSISAQLHLSTENCVTELMTAVREMRDSADSMVRDLDARSRELNDRIEYYQSNVSESIEKSLSKMDQKYGIRKK